jgi:hypothetical protein
MNPRAGLKEFPFKQRRNNEIELQQGGNQPCDNASEHCAGQQILCHFV